MQLEFSVKGQMLKRTDAEKPVTNSRGYLKARFVLPDEYTGTITANFGKIIEGSMHSVPMTVGSNGICDVPDEVLTHAARKDMEMYVWLSSTDSAYIPTNVTVVRVYGSGGGVETDPAIPETENQYQEIVRMYEEIMQKSDGELQSSESLPKLYLEGDISIVTKEVEAVADFVYVSGTGSFSGALKIKWQGTSSIAYPKKNFTIKLYEDETLDKKYKVDMYDWGKQNKFCLKANWIDHSHARNIVSARLWGEMVASREHIPRLIMSSPNYGAIDGYPFELYVNGEYQGLYTWNIPKDGWMFDMDDDITTHTILCAESHTGAGAFSEPAVVDGTDWSLEFPDDLYPQTLASFNAAISHVTDTNDATFVSTFSQHFDLEACIDYYLFSLAMCHYDGLGKNLLMITYDGAKWYPSMYDMDSTWGLFFDGQGFNSSALLFMDEYLCSNSLLWERLRANYPQQIYDRWMELRNTTLNPSRIINEFEEFMGSIGDKRFEKDLEAWPDIPSHDTDHLEQIKQYAIERFYYTDNIINSYLHKNMLNPKLVKANIWVNTETGAETADGGYYTSAHMPVIEGNDYTVSGGGYARIAYYDKDYNFLDGVEGDSPLTMQAPNDYARIARVSFQKEFLKTIMMEHGSEATEYEPYGGTGEEPEEPEYENIFNANTAESGYFVRNDNGRAQEEYGYYSSDYIAATPGDYIVSGGGWSRLIFFDGAFQYLAGAEGNSPLTATAPSNTAYVRTSVQTATTTTTMLETGNVAHPFVAYTGVTPPVVNLFNSADTEADIRIDTSNGAEVSDSDYVSSKFIAVTGNHMYSLSGQVWGFVAYYDSTQTFISGSGREGSSPFKALAPYNAAYARVTANKSAVSTTMFEKGSNAHAWVIYR